jgi:CubicO group peptidase (beta-lactamase class C family)
MLARSRFFLAALLVVPLPLAGDPVDDFAKAQMARGHIPGMAVVVIQDGVVKKLAGYGVANLDWDDPVSETTAFQIASATKPFTGLLLLKLVEQGKLRLEDGVRTHLPDAPETWAPITIRHLATHTSGLRMDFGPGKDFPTMADAVTAAYALPLDYPTGTRAQYALTDFVVLARILEKVSGRDYVTLLRDEVTGPLGMGGTRFDDAAEDGPVRSWLPVRRRATTYRWNGTVNRAYAFYYPRFTYSAGGLFSTPADLARLLVAIDRKTLLQPASLEALWTPGAIAGGGPNDFAIGWVSGRYRGLREVGHSGGPALGNILYFPERRLGIAVLTNQGTVFPVLAELVADLYLPEDAQAKDPEVADANPALTARLLALVTNLGDGAIREEDYSEGARAKVVPALRAFGIALMTEVGPPTSFRLIGRRTVDGGTEYTYRALSGRHPMKWRFVVDDKGRITDLEPSSGD